MHEARCRNNSSLSPPSLTNSSQLERQAAAMSSCIISGSWPGRHKAIRQTLFCSVISLLFRLEFDILSRVQFPPDTLWTREYPALCKCRQTCLRRRSVAPATQSHEIKRVPNYMGRQSINVRKRSRAHTTSVVINREMPV